MSIEKVSDAAYANAKIRPADINRAGLRDTPAVFSLKFFRVNRHDENPDGRVG